MDPYQRGGPMDPPGPYRPVPPATQAAFHAVQLVWLIVGVVVAILTLDFFLRLFGANPVGFALLVYDVAAPLVSPFVGIFGNTATDVIHVARWADVLGIVVYSLLGLLAARLIALVSVPRRPSF